MKAIRWLLKLVLVIMTLPLILAVWLIKWFVVFLHHCSAWIFYLLGSVLLATAILSYLMQQSQGMEALQMLIGGFVMPSMILIDTEIITNGPIQNIKAGIGDTISNYMALLDWEFAVSRGKDEMNGYTPKKYIPANMCSLIVFTVKEIYRD